MPANKFRYYNKLNARQKRIYDRSDGVSSVRLPAALPLRDSAARLAEVLAQDDRDATQTRAQMLVDGLLYRLHVPPVEVKVLAIRPSTSAHELHGLYEFGGNRRRPLISVWMRTAQKRNVVAFRTFLRTLLHEVVHHLDYHHLKLEDSYHTQGFYKRAESLYRQVAPAGTTDRHSTKGTPASAAAGDLLTAPGAPRLTGTEAASTGPVPGSPSPAPKRSPPRAPRPRRPPASPRLGPASQPPAAKPPARRSPAPSQPEFQFPEPDAGGQERGGGHRT